MSNWAKQLEQAELKLEQSTGAFNLDMSQLEINFWQEKLKHAKAGSQQYFDILKRLEPLLRAQQNEAASDEKRASQERIQLIEAETRATIKGAQDQLAVQKASIADQIEAIGRLFDMGQISREVETAAIDAEYRKQAQGAQDAALTEALATNLSLTAQIRSAVDGSAEQQRLIVERLQAWQDYEAKRAQISADTNRQIVKNDGNAVDASKSAWTPMVHSFTAGMLQMAEGAQTFAQVMRSLGNQLANNFLKTVVDPMVTGWLRGIQVQIAARIAGNNVVAGVQAAGAAKTAAVDAAANKKSIMGDAAAAGGKAYKTMAGVFPAPLWGILAGGAAFAGVMAFEGMLPSAARGYDIPAGVNPLTQLHAEEMVLPASIARPLRGLLAANDAGANDGAGFGGGAHYHTHNYHISALDGVSVRRVLEANHTAHEQAIESLVRKRNGRGFGS
jgi:hypothetical protein